MTSTRDKVFAVDNIVAGLAAHIDSLCAEVFPAGVRERDEYRVGSLAGEPGRSLGIHLRGAKAGVWCDFSTGEAGDALDLVAAVLFAGDKRQALAWAREWLALDSAAMPAADERDESGQRDADARLGAALRIFFESQPSIAGTIADKYLRSRALDLSTLRRQPRALRFHPALWNVESQRPWPALVAGISAADGRIIAVHRTWLAPDGSGKAPLGNPKMTLGNYRGGCIRLWRGRSGLALKDVLDREEVLISEGIEDGLTAAIDAPEYRTVCAVSLANMAAVELPKKIHIVTLLAQNDGPDSPAEKALGRAIAAFQAQGRLVRIARPPPGVKDLNELAQLEDAELAQEEADELARQDAQ